MRINRHDDIWKAIIKKIDKSKQPTLITQEYTHGTETGLRPDIEFQINDKFYYADTVVSQDSKLNEAFNEKIQKYRTAFKNIIPIVVRYNGMLFDKSTQLIQ